MRGDVGPLDLYLDYYSSDAAGCRLGVPLATLASVCVLKQAMKAAGRVGRGEVRLFFVPAEPEGSTSTFYMRLGSLNGVEHEVFATRSEAPSQVLGCVLPCLYVPNERLVITGMCSVMRYMTKAKFASAADLLGYQGNCLSAPAEASTWTRFCEVDLPKAALEAESVPRGTKEIVLPRPLVQYEKHLGQPVKMHNIRKRMQQSANGFIANNGEGSDGDPIHAFARSQHIFAEGPDFLLSDAILFPYYYVIRPALLADLPLTKLWFERASSGKCDALTVCQDVVVLPEHGEGETFRVSMPDGVADQSLYKSDPKRLNPASRKFTRQADIDRILASIRPRLVRRADRPTSAESIRLDWNSMPTLVHPLGGDLPPERLDKKCQQLENMAAAVLGLYTEGDVIVDFCSGGGHLAILLAHLLPESTVVMVENKEQSLRRAMARAEKLGLTNCHYYLGNMDYFVGNFDVGVSLHACGVATDLVIQACVDRRASFVSCPCCYGSVQENHMLSYPRSQRFKHEPISFEDYLVIGHTADQTHRTNAKDSQGQLAMDIIDSDRIHMALETGMYDLRLSKLEPESCTTKNNLIVGSIIDIYK